MGILSVFPQSMQLPYAARPEQTHREQAAASLESAVITVVSAIIPARALAGLIWGDPVDFVEGAFSDGLKALLTPPAVGALLTESAYHYGASLLFDK